jgi:phenylalanyl-tRNA synthetase beta chain
MLLPISWLREIVDLTGISNDVIEKSLFSCGLEVEERKSAAPDISGVVVGVLKSVEKMENSEHLHLCKVDCGTWGDDIQIVTGASNIKAGDHVPVALHGATVYGREGKVTTIKNGKLLGTPSNGMLCSGEELGIDDGWYEGASVYGILILDSDTQPGNDIKDVLDLDDEVWDISVTANLPHCQSVWGIARELAALLDRPLTPPALDYTATATGKDSLTVTVQAPDLCPRYIAHYVKDIRIAPSPRWMRRRLILTGHKPINTIVDITNYVLTELGQPMHAFDLSTLAGGQIVVRRATDGEKITTLDEHTFTLTHDHLVICDANKPVALAGIMGGLNSEIREGTAEVLFECAKFARDNIRHTSRELGQSSDSSHRYEKGVDEYTTEMASRRALHLVEELGCGTVTKTHIDCCADPNPAPRVITTTFEKLNMVLGIEVPRDTVLAILRRMNYTLTVKGDTLTATAPAYREDIEDYPDLAEDVIKMYGYEHITPRLMVGSAITAGGFTTAQQQTMKVKETLVQQGFYELINYSFYSAADLDLLRLPADSAWRNTVKLLNPLSENYAIMRTTLVPTLLRILSHNGKRGHADGRFFELANTFTPASDAKTLPDEHMKLGFALWGSEESFFTAKGAIEAIGDAFGLTFTYERTALSFLHPGATAKVLCEGKEIGYFGQLSYECAADAEIVGNAFVGELDYEALSAFFPELIKYVPIPRFPTVSRDLALVADEALTCGEITEVIRAACKNVTEVRLFDVYRSEQIGKGKKSMAFGLTFTPAGDAPLSSDAVDKFVDKILKSLSFRLHVAIR